MASTSATPFDFAQELARLQPSLQLVETEDSWQKIEKAIAKLDAVTKAGAYKNEAYVALLKEQACPSIVKALLSERTRLSGVAADFVMSAAPRLGARFDALVSTLVPPLLLCCARTNKVALARAKKCLLLIARHCRLVSLLPLMREAAHDKAVTLRSVGVEVTLTLMQAWQAQAHEDFDHLTSNRIHDIEDIIRATATDRDPEVRQISKKTFEAYSIMFPDRVESFTAPLTPTSRRYLALSAPRTHAAASSIPRSDENVQRTIRPPSRLQNTRRPLEAVQPGRRNVEAVQDAAKTASRVEAKAPTQRSLSSTSGRSVSQTSAKSRNVQEAAIRPDSKRVAKPPSPSSTSPHTTVVPQAAPRHELRAGRQRSASPAPAPTPALSKEESMQRAALQSEVARQSAATPSRAIAARLALEQFDMRAKQRAGGSSAASSATMGKASGSNRAALTAFAIAASKKQSPRRMPVRVPLVAKPAAVEPKVLEESKENASPAASASLAPSPMQPMEIVAGPSSTETKDDDVFESRPLTSATVSPVTGLSFSPVNLSKSTSPSRSTPLGSAKKTGSSFSKGLNARGQLLGSKGRSSPAVARSVRSNVQPTGSNTPRSFFASHVLSGTLASTETKSVENTLHTPALATHQEIAADAVSPPVHQVSEMHQQASQERQAALPSAPLMLGVQSPLSNKSAAAAALARSPPSVMLRQMALTMLSSRPAHSSPLAAARLQPQMTTCALSSPLKAKTAVPASSALPTPFHDNPKLAFLPLQRCRKI